MGTRTEPALAIEEGESPLFLRIARALSDDIRRGRLRATDALPGTRALAESLGVNRNTVVAAYAELAAEGWAVARGGGGTYVTETLPDPRPRNFARSPVRCERVPASPAYGLAADGAPALAFVPPAGTLLMLGGVPDVRLAPASLFARALRRVLTAPNASEALSYGDPRGDSRLRTALADLVRERRGIPAQPENVVVTRGSQMALELAARVLVAPGGAIAVEALGYRPAWEAFRRAGARVVPIAVDRHGMDVDALTQRVRRDGIGAVYVTPHHQYPTTVTLAPARRIALLALARRERIAIVEDDYDHELHYRGRPVLPLASADTHGSVVYVGTLSKVLAPGLRIGYAVAPVPVVERLARERHIVDRQGDHVWERAAAEMLDDGTIARHVRRMRSVYRTRCEQMVERLARTFGDSLQLRMPSGGTALWVRVRLPAAEVIAWERRALEEGVAFVAGERLSFDRRAVPFVRLGFASLDDDEACEAVRRLARAFPRRL